MPSRCAVFCRGQREHLEHFSSFVTEWASRAESLYEFIDCGGTITHPFRMGNHMEMSDIVLKRKESNLSSSGDMNGKREECFDLSATIKFTSFHVFPEFEIKVENATLKLAVDVSKGGNCLLCNTIESVLLEPKATLEFESVKVEGLESINMGQGGPIQVISAAMKDVCLNIHSKDLQMDTWKGVFEVVIKFEDKVTLVADAKLPFSMNKDKPDIFIVRFSDARSTIGGNEIGRNELSIGKLFSKLAGGREKLKGFCGKYIGDKIIDAKLVYPSISFSIAMGFLDLYAVIIDQDITTTIIVNSGKFDTTTESGDSKNKWGVVVAAIPSPGMNSASFVTLKNDLGHPRVTHEMILMSSCCPSGGFDLKYPAEEGATMTSYNDSAIGKVKDVTPSALNFQFLLDLPEGGGHDYDEQFKFVQNILKGVKSLFFRGSIKDKNNWSFKTAMMATPGHNILRSLQVCICKNETKVGFHFNMIMTIPFPVENYLDIEAKGDVTSDNEQGFIVDLKGSFKPEHKLTFGKSAICFEQGSIEGKWQSHHQGQSEDVFDLKFGFIASLFPSKPAVKLKFQGKLNHPKQDGRCSVFDVQLYSEDNQDVGSSQTHSLLQLRDITNEILGKSVDLDDMNIIKGILDSKIDKIQCTFSIDGAFVDLGVEMTTSALGGTDRNVSVQLISGSKVFEENPQAIALENDVKNSDWPYVLIMNPDVDTTNPFNFWDSAMVEKNDHTQKADQALPTSDHEIIISSTDIKNWWLKTKEEINQKIDRQLETGINLKFAISSQQISEIFRGMKSSTEVGAKLLVYGFFKNKSNWQLKSLLSHVDLNITSNGARFALSKFMIDIIQCPSNKLGNHFGETDQVFESSFTKYLGKYKNDNNPPPHNNSGSKGPLITIYFDGMVKIGSTELEIKIGMRLNPGVQTIQCVGFFNGVFPLSFTSGYKCYIDQVSTYLEFQIGEDCLKELIISGNCAIGAAKLDCNVEYLTDRRYDDSGFSLRASLDGDSKEALTPSELIAHISNGSGVNTDKYASSVANLGLIDLDLEIKNNPYSIRADAKVKLTSVTDMNLTIHAKRQEEDLEYLLLFSIGGDKAPVSVSSLLPNANLLQSMTSDTLTVFTASGNFENVKTATGVQNIEEGFGIFLTFEKTQSSDALLRMLNFLLKLADLEKARFVVAANDNELVLAMDLLGDRSRNPGRFELEDLSLFVKLMWASDPTILECGFSSKFGIQVKDHLLKFEASASLGPDGADISGEMETQWEKPLGISGITIQDGGIEVKVGYELEPLRLALAGGIQVFDTVADFTLFADLEKEEYGLMFDVENLQLSLSSTIGQMLGISIPPLLNEVASISFKQIYCSVSTANRVLPVPGKPGKCVPPGITIKVDDLKMFHLIEGSGFCNLETLDHPSIDIRAWINPIHLVVINGKALISIVGGNYPEQDMDHKNALVDTTVMNKNHPKGSIDTKNCAFVAVTADTRDGGKIDAKINGALQIFTFHMEANVKITNSKWYIEAEYDDDKLGTKFQFLFIGEFVQQSLSLAVGLRFSINSQKGSIIGAVSGVLTSMSDGIEKAKEKVDKKFDDAEREVNKLQNEINSIMAQDKKGLQKAEHDLQIARQKVHSLTSKRDSLRSQARSLRHSHCSWWKKIGRKIKALCLEGEADVIDVARKVAEGVLETIESGFEGLEHVVAADPRVVALEAAKLTAEGVLHLAKAEVDMNLELAKGIVDVLNFLTNIEISIELVSSTGIGSLSDENTSSGSDAKRFVVRDSVLFRADIIHPIKTSFHFAAAFDLDGSLDASSIVKAIAHGIGSKHGSDGFSNHSNVLTYNEMLEQMHDQHGVKSESDTHREDGHKSVFAIASQHMLDDMNRDPFASANGSHEDIWNHIDDDQTGYF